MVQHRVRAAALGAMVALTLAVATPAGAGGTGHGHDHGQVTRSSGTMSDLSPGTTDPTDGARARATAVSGHHGTKFVLKVRGLDRAAKGMMLGAHVHVGPCVVGDGAVAGPHYNSSGGATVDASTEVWLDITVGRHGTARATAKVPFVIPSGGARSIVIHAMPTAPSGAAGARLACLPFEM